MKHIILLLLSFTFSNSVNGQILNLEFDSGTCVDASGQPCIDLTEWDTNNEGNANGFDTAPNKRIQEGNENCVSITSGYESADGLCSETISQITTVDRLTFIEHSDNEDLIFTDSIKVEEMNYSTKRISLTDLPNTQTENIKVEFKTFGQLGQWEAFQVYSEFNILKIEDNYISSTDGFRSEKVTTFPNPVDSSIIQDESSI